MGVDKIEIYRNFRNYMNDELARSHEHKYGLWNKSFSDNGEIIYDRSCLECGHVEKISVSSPLENIEGELKKQVEADKLVNFFVDSSDEDLTDENILFYFMNTYDFHSRMGCVGIDKIYKKLIDVNKVYEVHNDYSENLIFNSILSLKKIGYIPEELFVDICSYLNRTSEYLIDDSIEKGKSL